MNDYRISLVDQNGNDQYDHATANSAQDAADIIRKDWPGCYIRWIALKIDDWE